MPRHSKYVFKVSTQAELPDGELDSLLGSLLNSDVRCTDDAYRIMKRMYNSTWRNNMCRVTHSNGWLYGFRKERPNK